MVSYYVHNKEFGETQYIQVDNDDTMRNICRRLIFAGVFFMCEPWPEEQWRVYVKKEGKKRLELIDEEIELSKKGKKWLS